MHDDDCFYQREKCARDDELHFPEKDRKTHRHHRYGGHHYDIQILRAALKDCDNSNPCSWQNSDTFRGACESNHTHLHLQNPHEVLRRQKNSFPRSIYIKPSRYSYWEEPYLFPSLLSDNRTILFPSALNLEVKHSFLYYLIILQFSFYF